MWTNIRISEYAVDRSRDIRPLGKGMLENGILRTKKFSHDEIYQKGLNTALEEANDQKRAEVAAPTLSNQNQSKTN